MEELTLEKLLTDMRGVLDEIQKLVDAKDIEGARAVFTQIEQLLASDAQIDLDMIDENVPPEEGQSYDHVLHQLLSNISGIIEVTHEEKVVEDVIEIKKKELLQARADLKEAESGDNETEKEKIKGKIESLETEIAELEGDLKKLQQVDKELKEVNDQINDYFINGGEFEEEETIDPKELEERRNKNKQRIESLEKDKKQLEEELEKEKDPRIRSEYEADLKNVNDELEVAGRERDEIEADEKKLEEQERIPSELKEEYVDIEKELYEIGRNLDFIGVRQRRLEGRNQKATSVYADLAAIRADLVTRRKQLQDREKEIVAQIEDLSRDDENQIKALGRQKYFQESIKSLEEELEALNQKSQGDLSSAEIKEITERSEQIENELKELKKQLKRTETNLATMEQKQKDGRKKERITELQERKEALEKEKEGLEGKLRTTTTRTVVTDRIDMGAEARRVGDNVFKTHEIRKELTDRNVSREDFLAFYEQGIEITRENIRQINEEAQAIRKEIADIFVDEKSDVNLFEQAENAYTSKNPKDAIPIYETIRKNMVATGKHNNVLEPAGFLNQEITEENLDKFADVIGIYMETANNRITELQALMKDQKENLAIFTREIQVIKDEQKTIEMAEQTEQDIAEKSQTEKDLRAKQIRATMFGADPEMQQEWDDRVKRFYGNRTTAEKEFTYTDKDGNTHKVKYETIKEYDEYKDDAFFLNLEDYKKNLEITTRYRASGNDPYSLTPEMIQAYEEAETKEPGSGNQLIETMIQDMEEYVTTFHGNVNEHALKYQNYKTAGSTLKAMKPVKGVSPANVKFANAAENTFRFFGIRPPKFTREDEHGQEVRDIPGGLLTLATDALVIGAAGVAIAAGPIGLATWGVAYGAKGVVTVANQIAARREMKKYGDEIRSNLPTPFKTTKTAREVARKEYYRTHDKNNRFVAWFKAKSDKYIFRGREAETEEAIVQARIEDSDRVIDARDSAAIETAKRNLETAERNQETRQKNYREVAQGQNTFNDASRDPNSVDIDYAKAQVARNAALQSHGKEGQDINPTSAVARRTKFIKSMNTLDQTQDMEEVVTEGGSVAGTAVTAHQKSLAAQMDQDKKNRVATVALTVAGKLGIDFFANGFTIEKRGEPTTETTQVTKYEQRDITQDTTTTSIDPNKTIGDYLTDGSGARNTYGAVGSGTNATSGMDIDSVAVRFGDGEISVTELGKFTQAGTHVHAAAEAGTEFSSMNADTFIQTLQTADPTNFAKYIETYGLENATASEIMTTMVKNGELYVQSGASGWNLISSDNLVETVTTEVIGHESVPVTENVVRVVSGETIKVFSPQEVLKSAGKGVVAGLGIAATEAMHENAHQTSKSSSKGDFEETTPTLPISKILKDEQEKANQRRREKEEKGDQQDQDDEQEM